MSEAKYVRLADHLTRGMRADLNSGFSLTGLNVLPMPDKDAQPRAYDYVRRELAAGRMEAASKAEFDEVHPDVHKDLGVRVVREVKQVGSGLQESEIQAHATKARQGIKRAQDDGSLSEEALEADEERRKQALKAQKKAAKASAKGRGRAAAQADAEDDEDDTDDEDESSDDEESTDETDKTQGS
jgi:hypothetical protein